ncbi:MAG TPA: hypothetical protein VGJ78_10055 [Vicinamibacterales bacterium]
MAASLTARRLLRHHFLRRFLDNDLISPHTDRHEVLVLLAAALAVPSLVITVLFLGQKYVIGIPTPGLTSVAALDDKFLYISASMLVMALLAAVQWDALALDERDTAILGPLPVETRDIGRAKLEALAIFVAAFAVLLNGVPSVVFPLLTVSHFHVSIVAVLRMIVVHAAVTMGAGAYAFLTILLLRELLRLLLGPRGFRRLAGPAQAVLVIGLGATLLLLPAIASNVPARWLSGASAVRAVPPAWFLGLYEAGTSAVTLTIRSGLGLRIPAGLVVAERDARLLYDSLLPRFSELARMSAIVLSATALAALVLYVWNNRRLPLPPVVRHRPHGHASRLAARVVGGVLVPSPVQRAGFCFTLQTLARSAQHRISIAGACAVAMAAAILLMHGIRAIGSPAAAPVRVLAMQTVVTVIVLVGVRQALAIPAELRANWTFSMAWNGDMHSFVEGVKRAVIVALALPLLALMFGLHLYMLGAPAAVEHAAAGFLISLITVEWLVRPEKLPLTCSVRPAGNVKALGPIYVMLLFVVAYNLGRLERWALTGGLANVAMLMGGLILTYAAARLSGIRRRLSSAPSTSPLLARIEFDDLPDAPTQRLGLSEPV